MPYTNDAHHRAIELSKQLFGITDGPIDSNVTWPIQLALLAGSGKCDEREETLNDLLYVALDRNKEYRIQLVGNYSPERWEDLKVTCRTIIRDAIIEGKHTPYQ